MGKMTVEDLINSPDIDIEKYIGFVYMVTFLDTGRKYIGKKHFWRKHNVKLGKKEKNNLPITRGRKKTKKLVIKESDWRDYYGSSEEVKQEVNKYPKDRITREILHLCVDEKQLTYYENKFLYCYGVIEPNSKFLNDNIQGRFFRKDLDS